MHLPERLPGVLRAVPQILEQIRDKKIGQQRCQPPSAVRSQRNQAAACGVDQADGDASPERRRAPEDDLLRDGVGDVECEMRPWLAELHGPKALDRLPDQKDKCYSEKRYCDNDSARPIHEILSPMLMF